MVLEMVQSIHLPPGSLGLMFRLGATFVQQAAFEKHLLSQRKAARRRLEMKTPMKRLHISGERYQTYVVH